MKYTLLALICALLGGCGFSEDARLTERCRELVNAKLVAPSTTIYHGSAVFRQVVTKHRVPTDLPDLRELNREMDEIRHELRIAEIRKDRNATARLHARFEELRGKINHAGYLMDEQAKLPFGEVYLELDSQNRSGAMLRSVGVCTFQEGDSATVDATFELSVLGEGRLPAEPPQPFVENAS